MRSGAFYLFVCVRESYGRAAPILQKVFFCTPFSLSHRRIVLARGPEIFFLPRSKRHNILNSYAFLAARFSRIFANAKLQTSQKCRLASLLDSRKLKCILVYYHAYLNELHLHSCFLGGKHVRITERVFPDTCSQCSFKGGKTLSSLVYSNGPPFNLSRVGKEEEEEGPFFCFMVQ